MKKNLTSQQKVEIRNWFIANPKFKLLSHDAFKYLTSIFNNQAKDCNLKWHILNEIYLRGQNANTHPITVE